MNNIIYLDNQATTPIDPQVLESMNLYLTKSFGNPASINHVLGWQADEAVQRAVAGLCEQAGQDGRESV